MFITKFIYKNAVTFKGKWSDFLGKFLKHLTAVKNTALRKLTFLRSHTRDHLQTPAGFQDPYPEETGAGELCSLGFSVIYITF